MKKHLKLRTMHKRNPHRSSFRCLMTRALVTQAVFLSCITRHENVQPRTPTSFRTAPSTTRAGLDTRVFEDFCQREQARHLFVSSKTGLGNRLLALAGSYAYAVSTERCLVIRWAANRDLPGLFNDLFENDMPVYDELDAPFNASVQEQKRAEESQKELARRLGLPYMRLWHSVRGVSMEFYPIESRRTNQPLDLSEASQSLHLELVSLPLIRELKSAEQLALATQFLRALKPVQAVRARIDAELDRLGGQPYRAVHLRSLSEEVGEAQHILAERKTQSLTRQVDTLLAALPPGPIYFTADSSDLRNKALAAGTRTQRDVHIPLGTIGRNSMENMHQALAEWYVMAGATEIYGTAGSTFSDAAALLSDAQTKFPIGPDHIYQDSTNLVFDQNGKPQIREW